MDAAPGAARTSPILPRRNAQYARSRRGPVQNIAASALYAAAAGGTSTGANVTSYLSRSTVAGNSRHGYQITGGSVLSVGDNNIVDSSNVASLGSIGPQ
jgi:hypothetical protein